MLSMEEVRVNPAEQGGALRFSSSSRSFRSFSLNSLAFLLALACRGDKVLRAEDSEQNTEHHL